MVDQLKQPKLVGSFIRQRREALGLSQRALGLLFAPPVTTQFISNVERGVTPLPPAHVPTLTKALMISESELMGLLEREYSAKLTGRLGRPQEGALAAGLGAAIGSDGAGLQQLMVTSADYAFMRELYDAFRQADAKNREAFMTVCESMLHLSKKTAFIAKPENSEEQ